MPYPAKKPPPPLAKKGIRLFLTPNAILTFPQHDSTLPNSSPTPYNILRYVSSTFVHMTQRSYNMYSITLLISGEMS